MRRAKELLVELLVFSTKNKAKIPKLENGKAGSRFRVGE
jgi:hypothetical protein